MDAVNTISGADGSSRFGFRHTLAGIEAGVLGALVIFAFLAAGSLLNGRSIWVEPNLFATTFYGGGVYRNHMVRASWTGLALLVVVYGGLGGLWGSIWREQRRRWLGLYGAMAGLLVYYLFFDVLWQHVNPLVPAYAPDRQLQIAHVLWGVVLARSPLYARRIAQRTAESGVPVVAMRENPAGEVQAPELQEAAPEEIKSGEVIR